jgi:arylsulfatase A-like enzyme
MKVRIRRSLIARTLLPAFVFALAATAIAAPARKPNFLFIYTDDQRWDAMGVVQREQGDKGRYPWFQTPNMDRIAAEGLRFRNAFVVLSLCAPSRAAFMSGRYNHLNGVANNQVPFPETSETHATAVKPAGYATAYIGKWHMGGQRGKRAGFDYSASFIGQGKYFDCPFEINGQPTPTKGWIDDVSTDYTIDFIKQHGDKPFSVVLGFKSCHGPFEPPERAKDRFAGARARGVPNLEMRAVYRSASDTSPAAGKLSAVPTEKASDGTYPVNLGYFRAVSAIDDNLGRLLNTLDELGLAEDTVVVFSSDNGYYHGEHGLGDKRSVYEESLRIPLLIRYPKMIIPGTVRDDLVLNIDLAPTFTDLAGVTVPRQMQGRSWRPLLEGKSAGWRQSFLAEYFWEANFPATPTLVAVRTHTAKLIKYHEHDEWTELFDLASDPYETRNLANDPQHRDLLARMNAELDQQKKVTGYRIPDYAHKPGDASKKKKKG